MKKIISDIKRYFRNKWRRFSRSQRAKETAFKNSVRAYFEGEDSHYDCEYGFSDARIPPIESVPIGEFGITKISAKVGKSKITCHVWLENPGWFIGAYGNRLEGLTNHLSELYERPVHFKITESNIWS